MWQAEHVGSNVRRHHLSMRGCSTSSRPQGTPARGQALAQELGLTKATASTLVAELLNQSSSWRTARHTQGWWDRTSGHRRRRVRESDWRRRPRDRCGPRGRMPGGPVRGRPIDASPRWRQPRALPDRTCRYAPSQGCRIGAGGGRRVGDRVRWSDARASLVWSMPHPAGRLHVAPNLHWFDADLADVIARLRLPAGMVVSADNEANLGAITELRFGAARGLSSFVYVSGGIGIGAGVVIDGRLARARHTGSVANSATSSSIRTGCTALAGPRLPRADHRGEEPAQQ